MHNDINVFKTKDCKIQQDDDYKYKNVSFSSFNSTLPESKRNLSLGYSTFHDLNNNANCAQLICDITKNDFDELSVVNRSSNLGVLFNGSNFGILAERLLFKEPFDTSFSFRTTSKNGLLLILIDEITNNSFYVELVDSQIKATLLIDDDPDSAWSNFAKSKLSHYIWIDVNVKIIDRKIEMTVKNEKLIKMHRNQFCTPLYGDLFIAGYPSTIQTPVGMRSKNKFFNGEMRNFKINGECVCWYTPQRIL